MYSKADIFIIYVYRWLVAADLQLDSKLQTVESWGERGERLWAAP